MITAVQHVARWDRFRTELYFAALAKRTAMFSRTSSFAMISPNGATIGAILYRPRMLYEAPVAILTFSQSTRAPGRRRDRLRGGSPLTAGATPPAGVVSREQV
jgi:hypothetical protein